MTFLIGTPLLSAMTAVEVSAKPNGYFPCPNQGRRCRRALALGERQVDAVRLVDAVRHAVHEGHVVGLPGPVKRQIHVDRTTGLAT